jgi:hypothetical protein
MRVMNTNEEAIDQARMAYMSQKRETDLITLKEAAVLVDRTVATIKKWAKKGTLEVERADPNRPNSALLVSRTTLMSYAATSGAAANPGRPSASRSGGPSKAVLQAELEGQRALVTALRSQLELLQAQINVIEDGKRTERERAEDWKDRCQVLQAELHNLRTHTGLPWWRKMLTTTAPPAAVPAK